MERIRCSAAGARVGCGRGSQVLGVRAGEGDVRVRRGTRAEAFVKGPLCAEVDGFSLHAGVRVEEGDRRRLEHLCRYAGRPAIAASPLSLLPDGRVAYEPKRRRGAARRYPRAELLRRALPRGSSGVLRGHEQERTRRCASHVRCRDAGVSAPRRRGHRRGRLARGGENEEGEGAALESRRRSGPS